MKKKSFLVVTVPLFLISCMLIAWGYFLSNQSPESRRQIVQLSLTASNKDQVTIAATSLPEFVFDISARKFSDLLQTSQDQLKTVTEITIIHEAHANTTPVETDIQLDKSAKKLLVKPRDTSTFKPGKYRLSLKLRTIEGTVDVEQDFTWGVIAVNTNKSIYEPGETAKLGFAVLNDNGETQCMSGYDQAKVWLTIESPDGKTSKLSTEDGTIKDSGKCGAITVTNEADFQAEYKTAGPGTYNMLVTAAIRGGIKRELKDSFKVTPDIVYDIERHDFPTRIFPGSPYPVSFKVRTKEAYNGTITDIIPKEFQIGSVSNNGRVEENGEFKKITWNVNLAANKDHFFTYVIRFPMISPEFYLVGPLQLRSGQTITFEEARQWQVASDAINSTSGVVTYEDNGASATWSRVWDGDSFGAQANMDTSPEDSRWFVEKSSPKTGEKLVAAWDESAGSRNLFVFRWNGSSWTEDLLIANAAADSATRLMDIAYEEESGDALLVYGDNTTQLKYRARVAGAWDGAAGNAGTALDSRKRWVKTKAQRNSDSILVGYLNDNERLGALIWDGSTNTFTNQFEDDDSPAQTEAISSDEEAFDIAWETQSGTPMMFWGTAANAIMYREFSSGAWQSEANVYTTNFTNDVEWVTAASDPVSSSNNIALAFQESDGDAVEETTACEFGVWDGSAGVTRPSEVTCRSDFDGRINNVAFENNTGQAMWVYAISESGVTGNSLAWRTWTSAGGFSASTTESGSTGNIESMQLHSDLNTTSMIALWADANGDLWDMEWDGSAWSSLGAGNGGSALHANIQGAGENAEAYGFGFDRNLETLAAYRWFTNANSTDVGSALTGQDTPYTLTSANQAFRLRLLLYYPDSLAINGRQYKLQFVDPGTGSCTSPTGGTPSTWTDVATSGTEVSFNNNASPADADNLTSNANDPTYQSYTVVNQDYEESNNFTNSVSAMTGDQVGKWDFSLIDNTTFDRTPQTFCFRVARSNNLVLQIEKYPQINTAAVSDVLIQGGSTIQGGTTLQ